MFKVSIITPVKIRNAEELQWLKDCIKSVIVQTEPSWEMIIVNDHTSEEFNIGEEVYSITKLESRVKLHQLTKGNGVATARNAAARLASSPLLLPLDADDLLHPNTLETYLKAWTGKGFLYPSVTIFGNNEGVVAVPPEPYNFDRLMAATYLLVGNLHLKSDWERSGGWRSDMAIAFEDWEYWIHLGELGVCGTPIKEAIYYYRRNPNGRIAQIKANPLLTNDAINKLHQLHAALYQGVKPMACCGGRSNTTTNYPAVQVRRDLVNIPGAAEGLVRLRYRLGDSALTPWYGPVTNTTYVFGAGKPVSYVDVRDAEKMIELRENKQQVFEVIPNDPIPTVEQATQMIIDKSPTEGENVKFTETMFDMSAMTPEEEARNHPIELSSSDFEEEYKTPATPATPDDPVKPARAKRKSKTAGTK